MFKLLRKKTYLWIASFLLVSMAVSFFIVYYTYTSLLTKDFMKKQDFLAMQTAQTMKEYLLSLEEQTSLLINKNQLPLNLAQKNYLSSNFIHFDNMDFLRIEIYSSDQSITSFDTITALSSIQSLPISEIMNIIGQKESVWYTLADASDKKSTNILLYVRRITHDQDTVGYLAAWVNPTTIEHILSLYTNDYLSRENQLFTAYSAAAIQMPGGLYQCSQNSIDHKFTSTSDFAEDKMYGKSYVIHCDIGIQDMTLILLGDAGYFQSYLALLRKVFVIAYIALTVLMIIFLYLFTLKIGATINNLYAKMQFDDSEETLE